MLVDVSIWKKVEASDRGQGKREREGDRTVSQDLDGCGIGAEIRLTVSLVLLCTVVTTHHHLYRGSPLPTAQNNSSAAGKGMLNTLELLL